MKKLSQIFVAAFVVMVISGTAYAGPADGVRHPVGDLSNFFGVPIGNTLPPVCDDAGFVWYLSVASKGNLAGTVDTLTCGVWQVTGTYDAVNVTLHATNPAPGFPCASWFTYTGTHTGKQGRTASGTWNNSAGYTGTWSAALCP